MDAYLVDGTFVQPPHNPVRRWRNLGSTQSEQPAPNSGLNWCLLNSRGGPSWNMIVTRCFVHPAHQAVLTSVNSNSISRVPAVQNAMALVDCFAWKVVRATPHVTRSSRYCSNFTISSCRQFDRVQSLASSPSQPREFWASHTSGHDGITSAPSAVNTNCRKV